MWIKNIIKTMITNLTVGVEPEQLQDAIKTQLEHFNEQMCRYKHPNGGGFSRPAHDYYQNILPYLIEALEELLKEQSTYQKEVLIEKIKPLN
jgi:hypothetical protein